MCEWGIDSRAPRRRHRSFFYAAEERNKRGHRGGEDAAHKGQVKGEETRLQFCARRRGRQQVQKYRKKVAGTGPTPKVVRKGQTTSSKMDHSDEMAAEFVFKKSDQHQQGEGVQGWATREEEATADQVFFSIPRGLKTVSGEGGDTELQDRRHRQGQDFGKNYQGGQGRRRGEDGAGRRR